MTKGGRVCVVDIVDGLRIFRALPKVSEKDGKDSVIPLGNDPLLRESSPRLTQNRVGVKELVLN